MVLGRRSLIDTPEGRQFLAHAAAGELTALLDRDLVLARAVRLLTDEFGFHCAWIAERAGPDGVVIGHTSGNRTGRFHGLTLRSGCGLGGKVFAEGRVAWVNGYLDSPDITHDYDGEVAGERIHCMNRGTDRRRGASRGRASRRLA